MPSRFLPPLRPSDRRVAAIALVALALLASVAAVAPALAQSSDPTSAPDAVGYVFAGSTTVQVHPTLVWNQTVDLTFTNITDNVTAGSAINLVAPDGAVVDSRTVYAGGSGYNVTFPSLFPGAAGKWMITGDGLVNRTFTVESSNDYHVSLSPSEFVESDGFATFTVTVTHAAYGYAIAGAQLRFPPEMSPPSATTGSDGTYVYSGPLPPAGRYDVFAQREFGGDAQPEVLSWTAFIVEPASTGPTHLALGHGAAAEGATGSVGVWLHGANDVGAITFDVAYNASVAEVVNVTPTAADNFSLWWHDDAANGTLRILLTSGGELTGPSGHFMVASIEMRAVASPGSRTPLAVTVVEAVHSNQTAMAVETHDGQFSSGVLGDADADGDVDADDLHAIVQKVLGVSSASVDTWGADVNRDGKITGIDVMLLEQHLKYGVGVGYPTPPEPIAEPAPEPTTEPTA